MGCLYGAFVAAIDRRNRSRRRLHRVNTVQRTGESQENRELTNVLFYQTVL